MNESNEEKRAGVSVVVDSSNGDAVRSFKDCEATVCRDGSLVISKFYSYFSSYEAGFDSGTWKSFKIDYIKDM